MLDLRPSLSRDMVSRMNTTRNLSYYSLVFFNTRVFSLLLLVLYGILTYIAKAYDRISRSYCSVNLLRLTQVC